MTIRFPKLTSYQQNVYDWLSDPYKKGKIAVIKSPRQCGKTMLIQVEVIKMALEHPGTVSAVFEPTLNLARKVYKTISKSLEPTGLLKVSNSQLLEIELTNGSQILFKSTEQINRGITITGILVLDECAYLGDEDIYEILPLVNAHNAPIIIASTPFTADGYYYEMYLKGLEENPLIKTFDWSNEPETARFLTPEKKALYKQTMSRQKYQTEIEGEFLTNDGLLFKGLDDCIIEQPGTGDCVYVGIDFAAGGEGDYTVMSVIDNAGQMVEIHRTNNLSPGEQIAWLTELIIDLRSRRQIATILGEVNSLGAVYVDLIKRNLAGIGLTITEWVTTNKSKQDLITNLQIAFENGYIGILAIPHLIKELTHYQADINAKTKVVTFSGHKCNDDMVMATAFAYWAYKRSLGKFSISFV